VSGIVGAVEAVGVARVGGGESERQLDPPQHPSPALCHGCLL
jgi:hypothetical protein